MRDPLVPRIKTLQRRLGLVDDGMIGPISLSRIEDVIEECRDEAVIVEGPYSLTVTTGVLQNMVEHEIISEAHYRRELQRPYWPHGASGVTVGIGYDLGYTPAAEIQSDWTGRIPDWHLADLISVAGVKGTKAETMARSLQDVTVPLAEAKEVFYTVSLPRYAAKALKAFPGVEELPPDAQGAILSLVYNRGTSMKGAHRREMRAVRDVLDRLHYGGLSNAKARELIAGEIESMKRLWIGKDLDGLLRRRDDEAAFVYGADRHYERGELVKV